MNHWQEYESKGQAKGKPVVPEPATYGLFLLILLLSFACLTRRRK